MHHSCGLGCLPACLRARLPAALAEACSTWQLGCVLISGSTGLAGPQQGTQRPVANHGQRLWLLLLNLAAMPNVLLMSVMALLGGSLHVAYCCMTGCKAAVLECMCEPAVQVAPG
jgi:hypothetical protein